MASGSKTPNTAKTNKQNTKGNTVMSSSIELPSGGVGVVDLFAGMGGLSAGFSKAGFRVVGVDIETWSQDILDLNDTAVAVNADLLKEMVVLDVPVVAGGPPCRPWSAVNLTRRGEEHPDRALLGSFFRHVREIGPEVFLLENVPHVRKDSKYKWWVNWAKRAGYDVDSRVFSYGEFGAPTSRRRLFTVGFRRSETGASHFFEALEEMREMPLSVRDAIYWLRDKPRGGYRDHVWPEFRTISRYKKYYKKGKYGWYQLDYEQPAPSFGNITKTYILHPEAGLDGFPLRVLSIREALCIMGFRKGFRFPQEMPTGKKYQMIADTVSPIFSAKCGGVIRNMLESEDTVGRKCPAKRKSGTTRGPIRS